LSKNLLPNLSFFTFQYFLILLFPGTKMSHLFKTTGKMEVLLVLIIRFWIDRSFSNQGYTNCPRRKGQYSWRS
jgi:hypothetical protein